MLVLNFWKQKQDMLVILKKRHGLKMFLYEKKFIYECHLYKYFACLSGCLSNNVKTTEPIGPKFHVEPRVTPGRFMDNRILKNLQLPLTKLLKILKIHNWNKSLVLYIISIWSKLYRTKGYLVWGVYDIQLYHI